MNEEDEVLDSSNSQSQLEKDLQYIKNEIIAKQKNGKYCKVSRILNSVVVENMTKEQHINYWMNTYKSKKFSEADRMAIKKAIEIKMEHDLTDLDEVIRIEKASKDPEKEKARVIKVITAEEP